MWASVLKQAIKRRKPDFSESYYGFRTFGNLLDEAQARGLFEVGRDEKSGAFVYRNNGTAAGSGAAVEEPAVAPTETPVMPAVAVAEEGDGKHETRRKGRGGRKPAEKKTEPGLPRAANGTPEVQVAIEPPALTVLSEAASTETVPAEEAAVKPARKPAARSRRPRKTEVKPDSV
jgi:hypothetical protein